MKTQLLELIKNHKQYKELVDNAVSEAFSDEDINGKFVSFDRPDHELLESIMIDVLGQQGITTDTIEEMFGADVMSNFALEQDQIQHERDTVRNEFAV